MSFIVAIDGPAGAGKGTVTSKVAEKFNLLYLDTGATYRCVTLKLIKENIDFKDEEKIKEALKNIKIEFKDKKVFLDGEDVTRKIREENVTKNVSPVSHIPAVRIAMVDLQRKIAEKQNSVLEGRDIGTNVFPNANVKFYLDASVEERAKRRIKQNKEKGIEMSEEDVRKNIVERDEIDKTSKIGPLLQAEDAIYIDSSKMSINAVVNKMSKIIKKKMDDYERIQKGYVMTEETKYKKFRRSFVKGFLASLYHIGFRVEKRGIENIKTDEGLIICANHLNTLDAAGIVLLNKEYIRFVAKSDLYAIKPLGRLGHLFNIIPIKRNSSDLASIKLCLKSLKNKEILGIFPEGTRKGMEKHADVKDGAVFLAYKAHVKIVPVGISGSFKPFSKVIFNYGKPVDVNDFKTDDPNWMSNATKYIMDEIVRLSDVK